MPPPPALTARNACYVLHEDPDLAEAVDPALTPRAVQECVAATIRVPRGSWDPYEISVRIGGGIGLLVPLHLTHSVLADLVAARRPTVSTSLEDLARQGVVLNQSRGWLLTGEPPGELLEVQDVVVPVS